MSLSCFSALRRVCVLSLILLCTLVPDAYAQQQTNNRKTVFPVVGTNNALFVSSGGSLAGCRGINCCPFGPGQASAELYKRAVDAAKAQGEPDGCPFAVDNDNNRIFLSQCGPFYRSMVETAGETVDAAPKMACCHLRPASTTTVVGTGINGVNDARENCKYNNVVVKEYSKAAVTPLYVSTKTIPTSENVFSPERRKEILDDFKEYKDLQKQCVEDSLGRIGDFWAQHQAVQCAQNAAIVVKGIIKDKRQEIVNAIKTRKAIGLTAGGTGMAGGAVTLAEVAADAISLFSELADTVSWITETLNESCGSIFTGLEKLKDWKDTMMRGGCLPITNFLERQATQCVRLDLQFDLALPRFNVLLQCPININISARISPTGFNCWKSMFAGSISGNPTLSGTNLSGGNFAVLRPDLQKIWDPECHKGTTADLGLPASAAQVEPILGGRVPGFACGPLREDDVRRRERIQGVSVLTGGNGSNGWTVGESETVAGVQITRCDYFDNGRRVRTSYVYGSGGSCNAGQNGFLDGGFETNTSCYPGGYTPAPGLNLPDVCMYPAGCLDSNYNFSPERLNTQNCPADTKATFNRDAKATIVTSTGQSTGINPTGGQQQTQVIDCSMFAADASNIICCDPQKQDCRTEAKGGSRKQGQPMCMCDEGTAMNVVGPAFNDQGEPIAGQFDALGRCVEGGNVTCCNPGLNGGPEGCVALGYGDTQMCEGDMTNSCVGEDIESTYTGPSRQSEQVNAIQLVKARPSPMAYLFIRPDANIGGDRCCTTDWCNVCPQHYVNAYGLSLVRETIPTLPLDETAGDAYNNTLITRGWPYRIASQDGFGNSIYLIGRDSLPITYTRTKRRLFGTREYEATITGIPELHVSSMIRQPLNYNACAQATGMSAFEIPMNQFPDGEAMAYTVDVDDRSKKSSMLAIGSVVEPAEYPRDYMNRMRQQIIDDKGQPLPEIPLCESVKICAPTNGSVVGTGFDGGGYIPPSQPFVTETPAPIAPPASVPSAGGGGGGTTTGGGGVAVPTADPPQAVQSLGGGVNAPSSSGGGSLY